ncbi:MAG TPA: hypothetical protein VFA51_09005, partial [Candidatus Udaeobacter sp.]|nr:hypothetical protein [Candidatus Udaeobacter sp.]
MPAQRPPAEPPFAQKVRQTLALDNCITQDAPMADRATAALQQAEQVDHQLVRGIGVPALTA